MQTLIGILLGSVFAAVGYAVYWLVRSVREVRAAMLAVVPVLRAAVAAFSKSSEMVESLQEQVDATRRMITAVESNTAAVKLFNSLLVRNPELPESPEAPGEALPQRPRGTPPPPPVMTEDGYAPEGESGVISQTDEEMAANEIAVSARELGIETDVDLVAMPPPDKINQF